jgi:hypothetical protein
MSDKKQIKASEKFPLLIRQQDFPRSATLLDRVYHETYRVIRKSEAKKNGR